MDRRIFMRNGAMALFAAGLGGLPNFIARAADVKKLVPLYKKKKVLVCIFQRGAMDGLMAVTPFADDNLKKLRPTLYMSPLATQGGLTNLDDYFGLHPALQAFAPYYKEGRMAIVHGVGSPNNTRSHFDAQDFMESGTPFRKGTNSGWLNRAMGLMGHEATPFRGVSVTTALPRSFYGDNEALAINNLQDFSIQVKGGGNISTKTASKSLEDLYDATTSNVLNRAAKESFDPMKLLDVNAIKKYQPANGAVYPATPLGNALKQIAMLIKMDVGLEIGFAESGGWDTHYNQGTANGSLARNLKDFSDCIDAFWKDMGQYQDDVTVMTMTEFGRTVHQNGTGGTDHGRASCMFVLGNDISGGKVYHNMQNLALENLEDRRDLPVTTDFRSVFSAVANGHLKLNNNGVLFPEWNGNSLHTLIKT